MPSEDFSHSVNSRPSRSNLFIPRGPTWFRQSPAMCSPWTDEGGADFAFMCYDLLTIFTVHFDSTEDGEGFYITFKQQFKGHEDNINAVSFCTRPLGASSDFSFVSCGNDRFLRIWQKSSGLYELEKQVSLRQDVVPNTCAALIIPGRYVVLAASLNGHVVVWETLDQGSTSVPLVKKLEKETATACSWVSASSDASSFLAIIGFKSGDVCCYSYDSSTISNEGSLASMFRLHAHDFEVCGLVPVKFNGDNAGYFATSGRDASVKVSF